MEKSIVFDILKKYKSVVVWGLKSPTNSCQRHVHRHIYETAIKIGCKSLWCDDTVKNNDLILNGSLIISSVESTKNLKYKNQNQYAAFHTGPSVPGFLNFIHLRVYGDSNIDPVVHWNSTTMFNKEGHMLSLSFGTDLLPEEFLPPIFCPSSIVNWVGSVWQDENGHGNLAQMVEFEKCLKNRNLEFKTYRQLSDKENSERVRESRIAPQISGQFQTAAMMPCRIWKNISYGQLGATTSAKSVEIFGEDIIYSPVIEEVIDRALSIGPKEYKEMTLRQQEIVAKEHTYLDWFSHVARALDEIDAK